MLFFHYLFFYNMIKYFIGALLLSYRFLPDSINKKHLYYVQYFLFLSIKVKSYTYAIFCHHLFFYNMIKYSIGVSSISLSIFIKSDKK